MAKERLKSPRARLFVALDLPERAAGGDRGLGAGGARRPGAEAAARRVAPRHARLPRLPAGEGDRAASARSSRRWRGRRRGSSCATRCSGPRAARPRLYALPVESPGSRRPAGGAGGEAGRRAPPRAREEAVLAPPDGRPGAARGRGSRRPRRVESRPGRCRRRSCEPVRCCPGGALPFRTQAAGCAIHPAGASRAARGSSEMRDGRQESNFEGRLGQGGQGEGRGARERGRPTSGRSSARGC